MKLDIDPDWIIEKAKREDGKHISAGGLITRMKQQTKLLEGDRMIIGFTGHRMKSFTERGLAEAAVRQRMIDLATAYIENHKVDVVISGMEPTGWDMAVAVAALQNFDDVSLIAAIPFEEHESSYRAFLDLYSERVSRTVVSLGGYAGWKMQKRNEFIVDHCDRLVALYGGGNGGTKNTWDYAKGRKPRRNLWSNWVSGSGIYGESRHAD